MNPMYGGNTAAYGPPRKVSFGWIGESWRFFSQTAGVWIVAVLIAAAVPLIIGGIIGGIVGASRVSSPVPIPNFPASQGPFGSLSPLALGGGLPIGINIAIRLFSWAWTSFFYGGVYQMAVKQVRGEQIAFSDIFSGGPLFIPMLTFSLIYGILVGVGTLFCIVPGLLVAGLFLPGYALIADGITSIGDVFTRCTEAMKADIWNAALFVFVMGLLILVSAIPCGLGLFVTLPMYWIISALAARDMAGMSGGGMPPPDPYGYQTPSPGVWPPPPSGGAPGGGTPA
jgi:hypothetical protein